MYDDQILRLVCHKLSACGVTSCCFDCQLLSCSVGYWWATAKLLLWSDQKLWSGAVTRFCDHFVTSYQADSPIADLIVTCFALHVDDAEHAQQGCYDVIRLCDECHKFRQLTKSGNPWIYIVLLQRNLAPQANATNIPDTWADWEGNNSTLGFGSDLASEAAAIDAADIEQPPITGFASGGILPARSFNVIDHFGNLVSGEVTENLWESCVQLPHQNDNAKRLMMASLSCAPFAIDAVDHEQAITRFAGPKLQCLWSLWQCGVWWKLWGCNFCI